MILGLRDFFGRMTQMTCQGRADDAAAVEIAEAEVQARPHPSLGDPQSDWLCASCLNRVATEKDRFSYEGQSEFSFKNPDGIRFQILTFSRTTGCREAGVPTLDHTW